MEPNQPFMPPAGGEVGAQSEPRTGQQVKAQARRLADAVKERAITTSEDRKDQLSQQVSTLVQKLDDATRHADATSQNLPEQLVDRGISVLRKLQTTLAENSAEELLAKAEQRFRAHPGAVIAGCVALGFIGARLVRK